MRPDLQAPLRLACVYGLFSSLWIFGGDYLLGTWLADAYLASGLHSVKDLLFILLSGLLIFLIGYRDRKAHRHLLEKLTRNSRLLQQAQHTAALGYWEYLDDFHWSPEALQLLQRESDSAVSSLEQLLSWLHPAERTAVQRALQALIEEHQPLAISARLYQPQRLQSTWLMLRGEADKHGQLLGTLQDISSQKRDETALRESEQRFRQLFERSPRIAVQGYDREHRVIYWNEASSQLYGYSMQEALGKRLEDLIIPPVARAQVRASIDSWLLGGPPIAPAELQLQRKDGRRVSVFSSHSLLRNTHDQLELYCIDIDLSAQKQVYEELQASEQRYRDLVEHLRDVIFLTNTQGLLSFLNPAWTRISGYSHAQSLGRPLQQFFASADAQRLATQLRDLDTDQGQQLTGQYELLTRQGQLRRVELQLSGGEPDSSIRGTLRDIHERFQTQALQQARNAVLDLLLAQRPLPEILDNISRRLQGLNPNMLVSIMLLDAQRRLHLCAAPSLPAPYCQSIEGIQAGLEVGSCGHAACSGELVIAEDLSSHPYWADYTEVTQAAGLRACWSLPFKNDSDQVLGTFGIYYDQPARPSDEDIALVTEFTRLASLAVQQCASDALPHGATDHLAAH